MSAAQSSQTVVVKRYSRNRLYDATNLRYVTVDQLRGWASRGIDFSVVDNETGENVREVLLA